MPWLAIPYEDENRKQSLKSRFGVCEIPTLVIISATDCSVVTYDGREAIMAGKNAIAKWVEQVNNKDTNNQDTHRQDIRQHKDTHNKDIHQDNQYQKHKHQNQ